MSLKIIHLSDIHTSSVLNKNIINNRIDQIVGACVHHILPDDDVLIVLSGDIAAEGKKEEYKIFENIFFDIVKKIKEECSSMVNIVCVPGNHDCDFGSNDDIESRNNLINTLVSEMRDPNTDEITTLLSVQAEYRAFESNFYFEKYNDLVNVKHFDFKCGRVAVYMVNTSWISQRNENVKERFFPISQFDEIDNLSDDFVITVFHHPTNWMYPDNCVDFQNRIREFSDFILVGHEHRSDSMEISGHNWHYALREGTELQNPKANSQASGFAIYDIGNNLDSITTYNYNWNGTRYSKQNPEGEFALLSRNARRVLNICNPNPETQKWLNDLELNIQHYRAENILLSSIFVWPDLDIMDTSIEDNDAYKHRVTSEHYNRITTPNLTLLVGESTSGKSTIAKELYRKSNEAEKCCVYIDASKITSYKPDNLQKIIDNKFIDQYNARDLEEFQQLSKHRKVLIVDNLHNLKFKSDKKKEVIKYFCAKFRSVIFLSNLEIDSGMLIRDCNQIDIYDVVLLKIRPMGNRIRKEFISKWFKLGEVFDEDEDILTKKVNDAIKYVDLVLGQYQGILPAYPIQLITILQCQNSSINNNQQISQYGYLYGSLVDASMSKRLNGGEINLYKGVLSELAFHILCDRTISDSIATYQTVCDYVNKFSEDKLVRIDADKFIEIMVETKILKKVDFNKYKFMYPYIFYYFSGSYISSHLNDAIVKNQIEYMCHRLYNEAYGNIMIFVCYFSNNEDVIDMILLNSFEIFADVEPYDFGKENYVLQDAFNLIDQLTTKHGISSNDDVERNQDVQLERKDKYEIQDGTVSNHIDIKDTFDDDMSAEEQKITSLYAALKTMSVLGQIIRCYPGNISGQRKVEIITEIHNLGMRTANEMVNILGMLEQDFVEFYIQREKEIHPNASKEATSLFVKNVYRSIMVRFVIAMIRNISMSFGGELSIMAAEKALQSVSGKLVLHDLKMYCNTVSIDDIINEYKYWKESNNDFAAIALKYLTTNYLELNKCDRRDRDRLCDAFGIDKNKLLTETKC